MNLNQSAHGDREFGFICARLRINRKVRGRPLAGSRACTPASARGCAPPQPGTTRSDMKIARFGDNMRQVAVTEGDKVEAEIRFGVAVNGYGLGDLVAVPGPRSPTPRSTGSAPNTPRAIALMKGLEKGGARHASLRDAARIELALRAFLGRRRLPGLHRHVREPHGPEAAARHRLAAADGRRIRLRCRRRLEARRAGPLDEGHGARPAGRHQLHGGLHLSLRPGRSGGARRAHAGNLPVDRQRHSRRARSIRSASAARKIRSGWSSIPHTGDAVNASIVDMGNRFRMIVNTVEGRAAARTKLPKLPVARALVEARSPTSPSAPPPGSTPAAPTTPASRWR